MDPYRTPGVVKLLSIKMGDIVRFIGLRDAPNMVVSYIRDPYVWCHWFDKNNVHHSKEFDASLLQKQPLTP